jgi:hypothetical protein
VSLGQWFQFCQDTTVLPNAVTDTVSLPRRLDLQILSSCKQNGHVIEGEYRDVCWQEKHAGFMEMWQCLIPGTSFHSISIAWFQRTKLKLKGKIVAVLN